MIELHSELLRVEIDPDQGADILSISTAPDGLELLLRTPWRGRADALTQGRGVAGVEGSEGRWLERYRGGWQVLVPVAGPGREIGGASIGFHGEASRVAWEVAAAAEESAQLWVELFSVPLRIERTIELQAGVIRVTDVLRNLSAAALGIDYVSHPAFGADLLDGAAVLVARADRLTFDSGDEEFPAVGRELGASAARAALGTLSGFDGGWARIHNTGRDLAVTLRWDAELLPYAWLWEELQGSAGFPWFGRVRTVAVEPASRPSGADGPVLTIPPLESVVIELTLEVERHPGH